MKKRPSHFGLYTPPSRYREGRRVKGRDFCEDGLTRDLRARVATALSLDALHPSDSAGRASHDVSKRHGGLTPGAGEVRADIGVADVAGLWRRDPSRHRLPCGSFDGPDSRRCQCSLTLVRNWVWRMGGDVRFIRPSP